MENIKLCEFCGKEHDGSYGSGRFCCCSCKQKFSSVKGAAAKLPKEKFGGISGLRKQQFNDLKKREYCRKHNINLVIIPYTDEFLLSYDYIMKKAGY